MSMFYLLALHVTGKPHEQSAGGGGGGVEICGDHDQYSASNIQLRGDGCEEVRTMKE